MISASAVCLIGLLAVVMVGKTAKSAPEGHCGTVRAGSTGLCVKELQRELNSQHLAPNLNIDGKFGPLTRRAVRRFQRKHHISADGIVGQSTGRELSKLSTHAKTAAKSDINGGIAYRTWRIIVGNDLIPIELVVLVTLITLIAIPIGIVSIACNLKRIQPGREIQDIELDLSPTKARLKVGYGPDPSVVESLARKEVASAYLAALSRHPEANQLPPPTEIIRGIESSAQRDSSDLDGWPTAYRP
jgi:peptidoglycan hydrolase-like protein with peptidoglycan-binding domain